MFYLIQVQLGCGDKEIGLGGDGGGGWVRVNLAGPKPGASLSPPMNLETTWLWRPTGKKLSHWTEMCLSLLTHEASMCVGNGKQN